MRKTVERITQALAARYLVEQELGRGGMAMVYLARDLKHDRQVAVKVLQPEVAAAVGKDRFLREIGIAAKLNHPNVLPLHDSGETDGLLYYVMPYIEGESLRQRLARDPQLPIPEGSRILRDVVDALAYAHQQGFVHRDIKPENVMLTGRHAIVADFGVAKAITAAADMPRLTTVGTALGTPAYMAPEQAAGETNIDHRADLYATGVVAYEMFAGEAPFTGATIMQVLAAHFKKTPAPLSQVRPSVPAALEQVIMKCLAKSPADRWQSAEEILPRLDKILASEGPPTAEPRAEERLRNTCVDETFLLTEAVCRKISREALDPRMIGDRLHFFDNQVQSDVLVCYLHGLGRDQRVFAEVLARSPYRGVAPTMYGYEPKARWRIPLPLTDHVAVMWECLRDVVIRTQPALTVLVGHSSGADLGFDMLASVAKPPPPVKIDAFISLDCNLGTSTCFVSGALANLPSDDPISIVENLRTIGTEAESLEDWLDVHAYLVEIFRKCHGHVEMLTRYAQDVIRPFPDDEPTQFCEWYRKASAMVPLLRCIFSDTPVYDRLVQALKLRNLDKGILGPRYREDTIATEPNTNHFDLADPDRLLAHVDTVVGALR